jgi:branched-chain amino acid transport system ATP-binding protein
LQVNYGGIQAVKGVDMEVRQGELVTLIGANGAGKTTTMKAITGLKPYSAGDIEYEGKSIKGVPPHELLKRGLAMVPEGRGIFARMSIIENMQMGAYLRNDKDQIKKDVDRMFGFFPRLKERATQLAGTLSGGEQQMLAMSRAILSKPKLLLLDEPSMGLSPIMVEKIFEVVREISKEGITVLLVEQNARLALQAADRGYVMDSGMVTMEGDAKQMLDDPKVRRVSGRMTAAARRRRMPARRRVLERLSRDTVAAFFMRRAGELCARMRLHCLDRAQAAGECRQRRCANRHADCVAWSIHRDTESTHESGLRFREGQGDVGGAAQGLAAWRRDPVSRPPDARIAGRRLGRRDQRRHQRRGLTC